MSTTLKNPMGFASQILLFLSLLWTITIPAQSQKVYATYPLNTNVASAEGPILDASIAGAAGFSTDATRTVLLLPVNDGALVLPQSISAAIESFDTFEIRFDVKLKADGRTDIARPILSMRTPCSANWTVRCAGWGIFSFQHAPGQQMLALNFADGKEADVPNHPALADDENIELIGVMPQEEWLSIRAILDFATSTWTLYVNGDRFSGRFTRSGQTNYTYDTQAIKQHVSANSILLGADIPSILQYGQQGMWLDNVQVFVPSSIPSLTSPAAQEKVIAEEVLASWNGVPGAATYDLEVDNDAGFSSPEWTSSESGTSVAITDLVSGSWHIRIRGVWAGGSGDWTSSEFSFVSTQQFGAAMTGMMNQLTGQANFSVAEQNNQFDELEGGLSALYDLFRGDILAFVAEYESRKPPLFESIDRIVWRNLPPIDKTAYIFQNHIIRTDYTAERLDLVDGLAFEAHTVFPGSIPLSAPRVASANASFLATYKRNPNVTITTSDYVVRPSGWWVPAGEIITVNVPASLVDSGVSFIVGAHNRDADPGYVETINRLERIVTEFPVTSTTMRLANPFGGGIYLKVPDGTEKGWVNVTIQGAVKGAFYSHVTGHETSVQDWIQTLNSTTVPWVDLQSDRFQFTMPLHIAKGVNNPDAIMERWEAIMTEHQAMAGRTEPVRPEYYLQDRQLTTPAFGARYPITVSWQEIFISSEPAYEPYESQNGTWNPFRVLTYRPQITFLHEMGHNKLIPHMQGTEYWSINAESVVHVFPARLYNTVYGMTLEVAFKASNYAELTVDETVLDWVLTYNFRNGLSMFKDPTMPEGVNDESQYQSRGYAVFALIGHLFGWEAQSRMFAQFYPQSGTHGWGQFIYSRDEWVQKASEGLEIDLGPWFEFWGVQASPEVRQDIASRFPQSQEVYDAILRYRGLVPENSAALQPWYESIRAKVDAVHYDRWDGYRDDYNAAFVASVRDHIDAILSGMITIGLDREDEILPQEVTLSHAWPNPFQQSTRFSITAPKAAQARVEVFDILGRRVVGLLDEFILPGQKEVRWDVNGVVSGVYIVRLQLGDEVRTQRVVLTR